MCIIEKSHVLSFDLMSHDGPACACRVTFEAKCCHLEHPSCQSWVSIYYQMCYNLALEVSMFSEFEHMYRYQADKTF